MKKCIVIDGKKSDWYEQAIFTLKQEKCNTPTDLYSYAENLIEMHLKKQANSSVQFNKSNKTFQNGKLKVDRQIQLFCHSMVGTLLIVIGILIGKIFT